MIPAKYIKHIQKLINIYTIKGDPENSPEYLEMIEALNKKILVAMASGGTEVIGYFSDEETPDRNKLLYLLDFLGYKVKQVDDNFVVISW